MKKLLVCIVAALMLATGTFAAFEKVNTYNNNFSDVTDSNWFASNVKTAYELGFMNGKSEGKFDPNGNVTIVEGITMATRLHAIYNGTEVKKVDKVVEEFSIGFNDPNNIVDLTERNSRNDAGISFNRCTGEIVDGCLVAQPDKPNSIGAYDPQITINGLNLPANDYNKVKFRMKIEPLPNTNDAPRNEVVQLYFKTSTAPTIDAEKVFYIKLKDYTDDRTDWFEIEVDLDSKPQWKDYITGIRFDPSDDNGIFTIDYITFSKSENIKNEKWYDMYIDYALENGIIEKGEYLTDDYNKNISRAAICDLFAKAIPESHYNAINNVKGIPDVMRDAKNADVYLMLYNAGIVLGDTNGNFNPNSDIKRSEIAAIINRVALPESRVKGTVNADWGKNSSFIGYEFDDSSYLKDLEYTTVEKVKVNDGKVSFVTVENIGGRVMYDPMITDSSAKIDADKYTKLIVRMKPEFVGTPANPMFDFFFRTEEDTRFTEIKSMHQYLNEFCYVDAFGWYILEVDLQ